MVLHETKRKYTRDVDVALRSNCERATELTFVRKSWLKKYAENGDTNGGSENVRARVRTRISSNNATTETLWNEAD